jgi:hypothetical protein
MTYYGTWIKLGMELGLVKELGRLLDNIIL